MPRSGIRQATSSMRLQQVSLDCSSRASSISFVFASNAPRSYCRAHCTFMAARPNWRTLRTAREVVWRPRKSRQSVLQAPARVPAGRSEPRQYHAEEFACLHGVHRDGTFVLREFECGALAVLSPLDSHRALAQEEQLDRRLHPGRKGRARVEANESEPRIPLGEGAEPLRVYAPGVVRRPVVSCRFHDNDVVIARLAVDRFLAGRLLVASLRAILVVALAFFIDPGEDAVLERTF